MEDANCQTPATVRQEPPTNVPACRFGLDCAVGFVGCRIGVRPLSENTVFDFRSEKVWAV